MSQDFFILFFGKPLDASLAVIIVAIVVPALFLAFILVVAPGYLNSLIAPLRFHHHASREKGKYALEVEQIENAFDAAQKNTDQSKPTAGEDPKTQPQTSSPFPSGIQAVASDLVTQPLRTDAGKSIQIEDQQGTPVGVLDHAVSAQDSGRPVYAVVSLLSGEHLNPNLFPVPWSNLQFSGLGRCRLKIEKRKIENAPSERGTWTVAYRQAVDAYYARLGLTP